MNSSIVISILLGVLAGGPVVGNLLITVLRSLGKTGAANRVAQLSPIVLKGVQIAEDVIEAPSAQRLSVLVGDLEKLTSIEEGQVIAARMRAVLKRPAP